MKIKVTFPSNAGSKAILEVLGSLVDLEEKGYDFEVVIETPHDVATEFTAVQGSPKQSAPQLNNQIDLESLVSTPIPGMEEADEYVGRRMVRREE